MVTSAAVVTVAVRVRVCVTGMIPVGVIDPVRVCEHLVVSVPADVLEPVCVCLTACVNVPDVAHAASWVSSVVAWLIVPVGVMLPVCV